MEYLTQFGYMGLFVSSFLAATILPLSSEVVLSALLVNGLNPGALITVATVGNVLGSCVNYGMGAFGGTLFKRKLAAASEKEVNAALARYEKYGALSLLFAWVPIIGDPLTVAAGVLRVPILVFLALVAAGKLGRYLVLAHLVLNG